MLKIITYFASLSCIMFFTGCATTYKIGNKFEVVNVKQIEIGTTTLEQILTMFGDPWRKGISNGNIVYTYTDEEITFHLDDTVNKKGNTLIIEFDQHNVVKNYYLNVPGKNTIQFTFFLHKRNKEKEEQALKENLVAM